MKNPNCDGEHCATHNGQVRVLPVGGEGNAILCAVCYRHEMRFRQQRNAELSADCRFPLPAWHTLDIYEAEGVA